MIYYAKAAAYFGAALAIGIGTIGPALAQGAIASKACENMGKYPESAREIRTMAFLGLVIVETSAVFALLVALLLAFLK